MPTKYKDWSPTQFDSKGLGSDRLERSEWLVCPVSITRDTPKGLQTANFETMLEILGGESDTVEIHRFGHWGPGWFEIILAHPCHYAAIEDTERALEDYPVLDDEKMSEHEHEDEEESWENCYQSDLERDIDHQLYEMCPSVSGLSGIDSTLLDLAINRVQPEYEHGSEGAQLTNKDDILKSITRDDVATIARVLRGGE